MTYYFYSKATPVSYTHLDVYKRQVYEFALKRESTSVLLVQRIQSVIKEAAHACVFFIVPGLLKSTGGPHGTTQSNLFTYCLVT